MNRSHRAVVAVAVASLVVAAGCGDDDDAPASTTPDSMTEDSMVDDSMVEDSMVEDSMVDDSTTEDSMMTDESMTEDSMVDDSMTEDSMMTDESMTDESMTEDSMVEESMEEESMEEPAGGAAGAELAAWQAMPITDVDGVTFRLGDYVGTPLVVEPFATWCTKCRAQLADTQQAAATLAADAAVVALSVETDLSSDQVAAYAADNGFSDIRFAVMSPELLAALADEFGTTIANPPSTPKIIVDADGRAGEMRTGPRSADDLVAEVLAAA